ELADTREWRGDRPWLADKLSRDLFSMEFFRHAATAAIAESPDAGPLSAAGFLRLDRDETDALALLFALRDLSQRFGVRVGMRDSAPDFLEAEAEAMRIYRGLRFLS